MTSTKYCSLILISNTLLFLVAWGGLRFAPESAPAARGANYAQRLACVECHGDPGDLSTDRPYEACSDSIKIALHPSYQVQCEDAMAYFEAVRLQRSFAERARINAANPLIAGERLARQYHCFQCHGQMGQGGFQNTGSLKGYVPGFFGSDFKILTRNADSDSLREWIMHGMDSALVKKPITGPIAEYFFSKQAINMPQFGSLESEEIETLVDYVTALHQYGPMTASSMRAYDQRSRTNE